VTFLLGTRLIRDSRDEEISALSPRFLFGRNVVDGECSLRSLAEELVLGAASYM
jgi:hypothetical protein